MNIGDFCTGFFTGFFFFIGFVTFRALRSGHWDTSNIMNVLRLIAFVAVHPEVFPYLIDFRELNILGPDWKYAGSNWKKVFRFWYLKRDEFKDIVGTA